MSHVLLFLAIKSHFLFVVLSRDTSISVILMERSIKRVSRVLERGGGMVAAGAGLVVRTKGTDKMTVHEIRIALLYVYFSNHTTF